MSSDRQTVTKAWNAYAALCNAAADDPRLAGDPAYILARQRAHQRWSKQFAEWDGR
jgi:hypothetical protein